MTRMRFSFARREPLKHISHLDMMRLFQRSLRRSGLPLAYSEGFNPHLRFNLAAPLPVNVTAAEEYGEIYFTKPVASEQFMSILAQQLPGGLELTGAFIVDSSAPSLPSLVRAALYRATLVAEPGTAVDPELYRGALERLMARKEILAPRSRKKNKKTYVNIRTYIIEAYFNNPKENNRLELCLLLQAGSQGGVSPFFVIEQLEKELGDERLQKAYWELNRERLYTDHGQFLQPLSEGM